jgi:quercetin dioxygenase-like cupin family protein
MKVIKNGVGTEYEAKGHVRCHAMNKLLVGQDARRLTVGMSHFLPNGGAEMSFSPKERAYFVIAGKIKVTGKNEEHLLEPGDLIYIAPKEERAFKVQGNEPATILVIMADVE